jgi:ArsR family transcriptional regulator
MKKSKTTSHVKTIAQVLRALGQPARIRILLTIGEGEVCVCHLEAALGLRQAYISQQLMALREVGLVSSRREGRYILYSLQDPALIELIQLAAQLVGIPDIQVQFAPPNAPVDACPCPRCSPEGPLVLLETERLQEQLDP